MRWRLEAAGAALLAIAVASGAEAQQVRDAEACQTLADADAAQAVEAAKEWRRYGGGPAAVLCEALALEALGALSTAAQRLESLALPDDSLFGPADRVALLELAAGFRLRDGDPAGARTALDKAVLLDPEAAQARALRARAAAKAGDPDTALGDLDVALAAMPGDVPSRVLRARLRRESGEPEAALVDADAAVAADPNHAEGWLEKGEAEVDLARKDAARESLLTAVSLDRDGPFGDRARAALQRLDAPDG